jgi:hypothetical protein
LTNIDPGEYTPQEALELFGPFVEKHYSGKYHVNGRSIAINLQYVDLDLVVTAAPPAQEERVYAASALSEDSFLKFASTENEDLLKMLTDASKSGDWKAAPLLIPDRETQTWEPTHPLEQIRWTLAKNSGCNGHYVNVVKALKWWRRVNCPEPKYPKGYPFEHMIGDSCPDGVDSVAGGVVLTLEAMAAAYQTDVLLGRVPCLCDRGVPENNVLRRLTPGEFKAFHEQVVVAAATARAAYDSDDAKESAEGWQALFGAKFPDPARGDAGSAVTAVGGYTPRDRVSAPSGGRFA